MLLCTKTYSMAKVGISAIRMRRMALATAASMPIREKEASKGSLWWNWTWKFSWNLFLSQEKSSWKISESVLLHQRAIEDVLGVAKQALKLITLCERVLGSENLLTPEKCEG